MQVQKTSLLTPNIGMVYSGMGPDYRVLVRKARKQAQAYYRLYHEHIPVAQLVRETAAVMQEFTRTWFRSLVFPTLKGMHDSRINGDVPFSINNIDPDPDPPSALHAESGGVRPFGVSLLMAGMDDHGPQLYQIDPSGSYFAWKASAIGKNVTNAKVRSRKQKTVCPEVLMPPSTPRRSLYRIPTSLSCC